MKDRKERSAIVHICNLMSFTRPFLLGLAFFQTALPCSGGYNLEIWDAIILCGLGRLLIVRYTVVPA